MFGDSDWSERSDAEPLFLRACLCTCDANLMFTSIFTTWVTNKEAEKTHGNEVNLLT